MCVNRPKGTFRWRRIPVLWFLGFCVLTLDVVRGDALDDWTTHTFPSIPLQNCYHGGGTNTPNGIPYLGKVVFHRGLFVAAGTGPCYQDTPTVILRSADGLTWARSTNQGYNGFFGVTVSPNAIVAVGFWGGTEVSADGINWAFGLYGASVNLNAVAYGIGRYVAVGDNFSVSSPRGVMATSTDGINWVAPRFFSPPTDAFVTIAFGDGVFWAATPTRLYRSTSGTTLIPSVSGDGERILCFGNNRFVRVGNSLMVNTNDIGWIPIPQPTVSTFNTLAFGAGMFVATAGRDVAISADGFNWNVRTNALPGTVFDMTFGNGVFMAVGGTNYYTSKPLAALSSATSPGTLWLHGMKNHDYEILATNNPAASNWPVLTRITLTNSPQIWTDTNAVMNGQRFYRSSLVP
jgi:hypothetical protein